MSSGATARTSSAEDDHIHARKGAAQDPLVLRAKSDDFVGFPSADAPVRLPAERMID